MSRKKVSTTVYITREQDEALKRLSAHTKVPVAEYIRQGIEMVLAKLEDRIPPAHPFLIGEPRVSR
jgi:predicted DNA-binding protein